MARVIRYPRAKAKAGEIDAVTEARGLKLRWVAQQSGVTEFWLAEIRRGREVELSRAQLVASVLEVEVSDVFDVIPGPSTPRAATSRSWRVGDVVLDPNLERWRVASIGLAPGARPAPWFVAELVAMKGGTNQERVRIELPCVAGEMRADAYELEASLPEVRGAA